MEVGEKWLSLLWERNRIEKEERLREIVRENFSGELKKKLNEMDREEEGIKK